jgi:hypothetical protein
VTDHEFLARPDVKRELDELVRLRMELTKQGRDEAELPGAAGHLRDRGIEIPDGADVRLLRTVHDSDVQPLAPMCNGVHAVPVNCEWIGGRYVCEWACP